MENIQSEKHTTWTSRFWKELPKAGNGKARSTPIQEAFSDTSKFLTKIIFFFD
jgi:hypothetical protein